MNGVDPGSLGETASRYWDGHHHVAEDPLFWMANPLCRAAINRRVTGDPNVWPLDWFAREFGRGGFRRGLSLGCGMGSLERAARRIGLCDFLLGLDFSPASLEVARGKARSDEIAAVTYAVADLNRPEFGGEAFDVSLRCVAPEGRLIPMGFASGTIPQIPANILLVKNVTVIGFYYGYYTGWGGKAPPTPKEAAAVGRRRALLAEAQKELMRWFTQDKLKATIAGTYDLADWVQAFKLIEERTVVGKAVLVP